jgi:hypothetical protein
MAPDQLAWLEDHFEDFCDKQARNTLGLFWPKMERDWFKEWPAEAELGMPVPQVTEEVEEAEVEVTPISDEDKRAIGTATADRKKVRDKYSLNILYQLTTHFFCRSFAVGLITGVKG